MTQFLYTHIFDSDNYIYEFNTKMWEQSFIFNISFTFSSIIRNSILLNLGWCLKKLRWISFHNTSKFILDCGKIDNQKFLSFIEESYTF